jgi:tRNA 2-thiouridine synthesizing protein B
MLHTVNKSPFERNALESCLRLAQPGSAILLIEDGVYGALAGTTAAAKVAAATKTHELYALGPDLKARGIEEFRLIGGIKVVDYGGFVDLAVAKGTVNSWL